jgi:hypothetical protein
MPKQGVKNRGSTPLGNQYSAEPGTGADRQQRPLRFLHVVAKIEQNKYSVGLWNLKQPGRNHDDKIASSRC